MECTGSAPANSNDQAVPAVAPIAGIIDERSDVGFLARGKFPYPLVPRSGAGTTYGCQRRSKNRPWGGANLYQHCWVRSLSPKSTGGPRARRGLPVMGQRPWRAWEGPVGPRGQAGGSRSAFRVNRDAQDVRICERDWRSSPMSDDVANTRFSPETDAHPALGMPAHPPRADVCLADHDGMVSR